MNENISLTTQLGRNYREGKYKERTQRHYVVRALIESKHAQTYDDLFEKLNKPFYWATLKHKDRNGNPSLDSWLMREGGGISKSIEYHLNALEKDGLVEVERG